jgi:hypothetical protein
MRVQTGSARADMRAPRAPAIEGKIDFKVEIAPADGTGTAKGSKRRLRYVAVFEQLSDKSLLTLDSYMWGAEIEAQWPFDKLVRGRGCRVVVLWLVGERLHPSEVHLAAR